MNCHIHFILQRRNIIKMYCKFATYDNCKIGKRAYFLIGIVIAIIR